MFSNFRVCYCIFLAVIGFHTAMSIDCYQCTSTDSEDPFQCNEWLTDYDMQPEPCDSVYGAKYCIKHVGRFEALPIECYQCSSATTIYCSDGLIHSNGIQPESCDHVFEAQYCIKAISMDGGIGTKRFCSSLDLGNYCSYVQQPGDKLQYRTCIYTCTGNGCNSGTALKIFNTLIVLTILVSVLRLN